MRTTKSRAYRKVKRAGDEERTRARIVDAAEELHATVGPARMTIAALAERAGVTRATVYRHFPDEEALFLACSRQWLSRQRLPNPEAWATVEDPQARLRAGLADVYRYYREGQPMLTLIVRDAEFIPDRVRGARLEREAVWRETLLQPLPGCRRATVRAAVAHALAFSTWRSLCVDQGLPERSAVGLMVAMVSEANRP